MTRDLLPGNATAYERAQSETSARLLDVDIDMIRRARRPDQCAAAFVPLLGWERSVHFWRTGDEAGNRGRIESSFADHTAYGTPAALEREISLDVGSAVRVRDFYQAGLEWPEFLVEIPASEGAAPPSAALVWQSALRRKNVRDWPVVRYVARKSGPLSFGAFVRLAALVRVRPADPTIRLRPPSYLGAGLSMFADYYVRPLR